MKSTSRRDKAATWRDFLNRIGVKKVHSALPEQISSLGPIGKRYAIEKSRKQLLRRCQLHFYLGLVLCGLAFIFSCWSGMGPLSLALGLIGAGVSLFSAIWKQSLPESKKENIVTKSENSIISREGLEKREAEPVPLKDDLGCYFFVPGCQAQNCERSTQRVEKAARREISKFFKTPAPFV